jgi:hypothetical protein
MKAFGKISTVTVETVTDDQSKDNKKDNTSGAVL